jgi:hypothetical protein
LDDLKVALQIFDVGCVSQLIAQGIDAVDGILAVDYLTLQDYFPQMPMEEKLNLLYGVQMINANQLDPKAHSENCGVCSNDDALELLRENNLSAEVCAKVSVENLKGKHLTVITAHQLCSSLSASMRVSLLKCLKSIKEAHEQTISQ